nr:uncharacterized protein LOC123756757 isoform X1 [Procambarus clarkii]
MWWCVVVVPVLKCAQVLSTSHLHTVAEMEALPVGQAAVWVSGVLAAATARVSTRQAVVWVTVVWTATAAAAAAAGPAEGSTTQTLRVGLEAPECIHKGVTLLCDYRNSHQAVHIGGPVDERVHKVFVYNSDTLLISESLCVNLSVTNVTNVTVVSGGQGCHSTLEFSSKRSSLNKLPSRADQIYLEASNITRLFASVDVTHLTVIGSLIDVLEVRAPLLDSIHAIFHSTRINTFKKMQLSRGSRLLFENTHVGHLLVRCLVVEGGDVVMRDSFTRMASEDSIVMAAGSTLTLDNYTGSLKVTTVREQPTLLTATYAPTTAKECSLIVTYFREYVACLVLMLLTILSFTVATLLLHLRRKSELWSRSNLRQSSPEPLDKEDVKFTSDPLLSYDQEDEQKSFLKQVSGKQAESYLHNLERLTQEVCTSMQKQKSLLEDELKVVEKECRAKLKEIDDRRHNRSQIEEDLINSELHDHETKYHSEEKRKDKNWEELTRLLHQIRALKTSKEALYNTRNEEEVEQVEYTAKLNEANMKFLKALNKVGQISLATWRTSRGSIGECHPDLVAMDDLFKHVVKSLNEELVNIIHKSETKAELEQYIMHHELNSLKEQRDKVLEELNTKYKMEHFNLANRTQTTEASKIKRKKLKAFYDSRTDVLTLSQRLEQTEVLSERSGHKLTLAHLNRTTQLQKQYINEVENILSMLEYVLRFNVKLVRKMLDFPCEELPVGADQPPAELPQLPAQNLAGGHTDDSLLNQSSG